MAGEPDVMGTQRELLELLDTIERLLADVRERVIGRDSEMHEELRKATNGDH